MWRLRQVITAITITRNEKYTAFCDTGVFVEGKCRIWPDKPDFNCPAFKKDVCCIVCGMLESCDHPCERINPD